MNRALAKNSFTPDELNVSVQRAWWSHGRLWNGAVAAAGLGVLGLARWLPADPRGFGTHEALGMTPCVALAILGIPCPFCGMTTAFVHVAHGRFQEAVVAQPAGFMLFFGLVVVVLVCLFRGFRPFSPSPLQALSGVSGRVWGGFLGVLLVSWAYKIGSVLMGA